VRTLFERAEGHFMKSFGTLIAGALLCACASHNKRASCDGHLEPINAPAPVVRSVPGSATITPAEALESAPIARSP
jgi:hypothetical protein